MHRSISRYAPLVALIAIVLALVSCTSLASTNAIRTVSPQTFAAAMHDPRAHVIQTHTPYVGEINGTDLIAQDWEHVGSYDLPVNKSTPILVYCRSGHMSGIAAQELARLGYTNITDLAGGMNAWTASGRTLVYRKQ